MGTRFLGPTYLVGVHQPGQRTTMVEVEVCDEHDVNLVKLDVIRVW